MIKEKMTSNQMIAAIIMFIFGSSVITGVSTDAHQDSWISLIMALIMVLPLIIIYARIIKLYPGEGLYDIINELFGKVVSKIIIILMTWYAIHLGALVLSDFTEYIKITTLLDTPKIIVAITLLMVTVYISKSSIYTLGKWALVSFPIVIIMVIITVVFSINTLDVHNIFPIMEHSLKDIATGAYKIVSFPFAETVLFLPLACFVKKEDSPNKIYISSILIGSFVLLVVIFRNLTVLGAEMMSISYFPSLVATRIIDVGDFLTRIEGVITINFILAGITKITICLIVAAKGMAKIFDVKKYRDLILPATLLILAISMIQYTNVMELFEFLDPYAIYAIPFQIVIPLIVWVKAEIVTRRRKKTS